MDMFRITPQVPTMALSARQRVGQNPTQTPRPWNPATQASSSVPFSIATSVSSTPQCPVPGMDTLLPSSSTAVRNQLVQRMIDSMRTSVGVQPSAPRPQTTPSPFTSGATTVEADRSPGNPLPGISAVMNLIMRSGAVKRSSSLDLSSMALGKSQRIQEAPWSPHRLSVPQHNFQGQGMTPNPTFGLGTGLQQMQQMHHIQPEVAGLGKRS